jgi:hypothetical protein
MLSFVRDLRLLASCLDRTRRNGSRLRHRGTTLQMLFGMLHVMGGAPRALSNNCERRTFLGAEFTRCKTDLDDISSTTCRSSQQ